MTNEQFKDFMNKFNIFFDQKALELKTELKEDLHKEMLEMHSRMDWMMSALDTDEKERLALGFNFDRQHTDHERRITKLELAAN